MVILSLPIGNTWFDVILERSPMSASWSWKYAPPEKILKSQASEMPIRVLCLFSKAKVLFRPLLDNSAAAVHYVSIGVHTGIVIRQVERRS